MEERTNTEGCKLYNEQMISSPLGFCEDTPVKISVLSFEVTSRRHRLQHLLCPECWCDSACGPVDSEDAEHRGLPGAEKKGQVHGRVYNHRGGCCADNSCGPQCEYNTLELCSEQPTHPMVHLYCVVFC